MTTAARPRTVTVTADVTVWVSRGTDGTLEDAARERLARITIVESVESTEQTGFRPRAKDVYVHLSIRVTVGEPPPPDEIRLADALRDATGVVAATVIDVEREYNVKGR